MWVRGLLRYYGVRVIGTGLERLDTSRPYVFLSNHQSLFDILAIFRSYPESVRFVTKRELFLIPFFGWYLGLAGYIPVWDPPRRFVDEQRVGPYRWWRHEHLFYAAGDGTLVLDRVQYGVVGGAVINALFVAPELRKIFAFRRRKLAELLNL